MGALWQRIRGFFQSEFTHFREFVRRRFTHIIVAGVSVIAGLCLAGAYGSVIDYTSSLNFCAHTCHEMESTVYEEYTHSKHFKNQHGVVVVCADCHVPHHNWPATFVAKVLASFELWNHFIDREYLPERFAARRVALAQKVWDKFAATNARECKACHQFANMVLEEQNPSARAMHAEAMKTDANCLDCHKGLTHKKVWETAEASLANSVASTALAAQATPTPGQEVYEKNCAACHNNLSPKLGDKIAWEPRIKQGEDTLVASVMNGKGPMPARGGQINLSDSDIRAAVKYIESKAK